VKDRLALNIIEDAERSGSLRPGQTVVEATSGNTGIGLAMVCAAKGYPLVVTMADSFSVERRQLMRYLGAKVVLTPRAQKGFGMYMKAKELAEANGWFLARQFETEANADIHESTTGQEILADFAGQRLDYFVTGYGTGGTVSGVGRVLRRERPGVKIILSEPANAQIVQAQNLSSDNKLQSNAPRQDQSVFGDVVETVKPAVVSVRVKTARETSSLDGQMPGFFRDLPEGHPLRRPQERGRGARNRRGRPG